MRKIFALSIFIIFIFYSCDNDSMKNIEIIHLDVENFELAPLYLSDFVDSIEYIKLETNDSCLVSMVLQKDVIDDNVFILDINKLYHFDRNGKFLRTISRFGEGPGEYLQITGFCVFPEKEIIVLAERGRRKIMLYDFDGNFLNEFKLDHCVDRMLPLGDYIVCCSTYPDFINNNGSSFAIYDFKGKLVSTALDRSKWIERNEEKFIRPAYKEGRFAFAYMNDTITYWERGLDIIYKLNGQMESYPRYKIIQNKDKNKQASFKIGQNKVDFDKFMETDEYVFFLWGLYKSKHVQIAYNKDTKEVFDFMVHTEIESNAQYKSGFVNDIDGGWNLLPSELTTEHRFVLACNSNSFKRLWSDTPVDTNKILFPGQYHDLRKLVNSTSSMDNPIVMVMNPK